MPPPKPSRGRDVCMFVASPFTHDTRIEKEAAALAGAGYSVRVIAAGHPGLPRRERHGAALVTRVDDDPVTARLARAVIRRRASGRVTAERGSVITREAVESSGARAAAMRAALRVHLRLAGRRYARSALAAARSAPAAVWIAHDLDTLPVALSARARLGGRVLYDSHELFVDSSLARGERRRWVRVERGTIRQADAVVTVSASIARTLAERYGIPEPEVVLNAPPESSAGYERPVDLRAALSLPEGCRIAIYVGGVQQHRGLEQLIEALRLRDDLALVMLGPGTDSYRRVLERAASQQGTADRVRFMPPVAPQDVAAHAAGADVGVMPLQATYLSYYFALPNKLFDYLQAGLPLVVSDFPEARQLVERHDAGVTCDPADPASIAEAIDRVTVDPRRHAELRANAAAAAPLYTWERQADKLLSIVERLT